MESVPNISHDSQGGSPTDQTRSLGDEYLSNKTEIVRLPESIQESAENLESLSLEDQESLISDRAKNFESSLETLWNFADSLRVALVVSVARKKGWAKDQIKELDKAAGATPETIDLGVKSSARLAARYCKSSEMLDWAGLCSAISAMAAGTVQQIKTIQKTDVPGVENNVIKMTPGKVVQ